MSAALLLQLCLFTGYSAFAQVKMKMSGVVTNETGGPVAGATITEKGTSNGTMSTEDGRFLIQVAGKKSILVISYTGYATIEVVAGDQSMVNVSLQPEIKAMNEVVVTGYGSQKRVTVTGAVAALKGSDIVQSSSANISNSIAGRVPGVIANNRSGRPGADESTIYVRGFNSFSGGTSPLIVVDGIPDRSFSRLNPNDIESITVLKDASAAIYGVRAANGVIMVTTKRGKSGKPSIQYDGNYGLQQLTRLPKVVNSWEYMTYYNEITPGTYSQDEINKYKAGNDPNYTSTEWLNEVFRPSAPQSAHSLSVGGGNENVKYYFSGQYVDQSSNFDNSMERYKQFNIRSNIDARVSKNLKINLDIAARQEDRYYPVYGVSSILHETRSMYPFVPTHWTNGLPSAGVAAGRNPIILVTDEPGYDEIRNYVVTPLAGFDFRMPFITEGLSLSGYASYDINMRNEKIFTKPWDAYSYNKTTDEYSNVRSSTAITSVTQNENTYTGSTRFIKLAYDRRFQRHGINAFAGYEASSSASTGTVAYRKNLLSDEVDQIFTGSTVEQNANGSASQDGRESYLGRVAYDFDSKYMAEVSLRYNGSFNFAPDKRWGLFPAVSVGWRISEERFFKENIRFIDQLKIRASWGIMGSDAVAQYQYLTRYQVVSNANYYTYFGNDYTLATALSLASTPNENITWEKQDTRNIGIDASMLKGKLTITADYFHYLRSDILAKRNASIPLYTGMSLPNENIGKSLNQGVDFSINYRNNAGHVAYNIGLNATYAKSKVVFADESANVPAWQKNEGYPIDSWLVYETNGIYKTQKDVDNSVHLPGARPGDLWIRDIDGNGSITSNDRVRKFESAVPKLVYGITMGLSYKGLSFNMVIAGQDMAMQLINPQMQGSLIAPPKWLYDSRWTEANPEGPYPRAFKSNSQYNSIYADFWLKDASFLRLKNVELSYTIPPRLYERFGLNTLRVYASGFNLLSFDHMKQYGIDAETDNITGVNYPQSRIIRFGINIGL